jgi:serine/threonine protein kinase
MPFLPYTAYNPIQLKHVIGKGGNGTVHVGYHKTWKKHVAVKKLPDNARSLQEAWMLEELQSCPHMVRYYNHYNAGDGDLLIAMELCHGPSLYHIIEQVRQGHLKFSEADVRNLARPMAETVLFCHEHGMIYGDIKPENAIVSGGSRGGALTMIDAGCVRYGMTFTRPIGTPLYFAPEKFAWEYGLESDVWSLGIVMYMIVCGHHPFIHTPVRKDYQGIVELLVELEATPLHFHHPNWDHISPHMKSLLAKMLAKDLHERSTIEEVLASEWWGEAKK